MTDPKYSVAFVTCYRARVSSAVSDNSIVELSLTSGDDESNLALRRTSRYSRIIGGLIAVTDLFCAKIKLDLPAKFGGKPAELSGWLFSVGQYCGIVGIAKPVDMAKLAVSRLEHDAFTWWRQLACRGADYQLGSLGWTDFKSELVNAFVNVDRELKL